MPDREPETDVPTVYRLAPTLAARLLGAFLVACAVLVLGSTATVAATGLPPDLLVLPVLGCVVGTFALGWWLRSRAWVLRLDAGGYAVRLVRGCRTRSAPWDEVTEAGTASPRGIPCLVLTLSGDRETLVPVDALAGDREDLVREVQRRLRDSRRRRSA